MKLLTPLHFLLQTCQQRAVGKKSARPKTMTTDKAPTDIASAMRLRLAAQALATAPVFVVTLVASLKTTGCQVAPSIQRSHPATETASYLTLEELAAVLNNERDLTLVEFCAPAGCQRCTEMHGPIDRLASNRDDRIDVRRVDLQKHPQLAWEFGITACPSYVGFRDGKEVFRATHPTSADLIDARLNDLVGDSPAEPLAVVVP